MTLLYHLQTRWYIFEKKVCKIKVNNLGSNTFGNPIFQNGFAKLAILPDYKRPRMLPLLDHQKFELILVKVTLKLKAPKNNFNKKCAPKLLFSHKIKIQKDSDDAWDIKYNLKFKLGIILENKVFQTLKKLFFIR